MREPSKKHIGSERDERGGNGIRSDTRSDVGMTHEFGLLHTDPFPHTHRISRSGPSFDAAANTLASPSMVPNVWEC